MSASFYDLLKYAKTGIASPDMTGFDKLRAMAMAGKEKTLTGIPPLSFKANGKPLISWSMKGNGVQSGTPTPDAPIMPQFVGVRTENLFDYQTMETSAQGYYLNASGQEISLSGWRISDYIPCDGTEFTINKIGGNTPAICLYDENKQFLAGKSYQTGGTTNKMPITVSSDTKAKYIRFSYVVLSDVLSEIMITEGTTTPSEYIPYGYKIPITCAGQTVPVYLGQFSTVRRVKKLVLTGEENWQKNDQSPTTYLYYLGGLTDKEQAACLCTHFLQSITTYPGNNQISCIASQTLIYIRPDKNIIDSMPSGNTKEGFKEYLAQQYANGTPVTIWYVLATPETGIVNEPLCKIGDYADELSSTDADVTIPTVKGQNTLTVDTDLQPSEMKITYK